MKSIIAVTVLVSACATTGRGLPTESPNEGVAPTFDSRIVHALLPLPNKGGSDWGYAWVPIVGPLVGGAIAAGIYNVAFA